MTRDERGELKLCLRHLEKCLDRMQSHSILQNMQKDNGYDRV